MQVFVYRLIDPSVLTVHEAALRTHVFSGVGNRLVEPVFDLSPISGGFKYFDRGRLWHGESPQQLPKSEEEAARAAEAYFLAVNRAAAGYRERLRLRPSDYPDPFPNKSLRHMRSRPVFMPGAKQPDHWISYWMVFLPAEVPQVATISHTKRVPVYGAVIEVRVGAGGLVNGVVSSARPWIGMKRVDAFEPIEAHHKHENGADTSLLYLVEGSGEPQIYLAPYYQSDDVSEEHPHGLSLRPACVYSLIIDIAVEQTADGARLVAVVMDSEGKMVPVASREDYQLSWLYARLEYLETGDVTETDTQELHLSMPGVYHVEIAVEHRLTEAQRTTYRQIVVGIPVEEIRAGVS